MNNETQNREQRLEKQCELELNMYESMREYPNYFHESDVILAMKSLVDSDFVKEYHQPENKAVDLETIKKDFLNKYENNIFDLDNEGLQSNMDKVFNFFKPYLSAPQKELSEGEIAEQDFELANNFDLYLALTEWIDEKPALQNDPVKTIGDRKRLIKKLREKGFYLSQSSQSLHSNQQDEIDKLKHDLLIANKSVKLNYDSAISFEQKLSDLQGKYSQCYELLNQSTVLIGLGVDRCKDDPTAEIQFNQVKQFLTQSNKG